MKRIEILADAFCVLNNYFVPTSRAYQLRNPGLLKAYSLNDIPSDDGYRVFDTFMGGYHALLWDLQHKILGKSRARHPLDKNPDVLVKISGKSSIRNLLVAYGRPESEAEVVVEFLRLAIPTENISRDTKLAFFLS